MPELFEEAFQMKIETEWVSVSLSYHCHKINNKLHNALALALVEAKKMQQGKENQNRKRRNDDAITVPKL